MHITVVYHAQGKRATIELEPNATLEELLVLAEVEMGEFPPDQSVTLAGNTSGTVFTSEKPLTDQGLTDGATVNIVPHSQLQSGQLVAPHQATTTTTSPSSSSPLPPTAAALTPEEQLRRLFSGPGAVTTVPPSAPATAEVDQAEQIRRLFAGGGGGGAQPQQQRRHQQQGGVGQRQRRPPLDPMDPEYQTKMYERIQEENMLANLEQAMEHTPEAFGRVEMLYVSAHVNKEPITAFVDSGAQMTIMNEATAERCGILRLLDRRAAGIAKGVGTTEILGRIHMAMVNLGGIHLPMSITVLKSQSMEFLIGLDQLKRHQMCVDLKRNVLQISDDVALPFLTEGELPKHMRTNKNGDDAEEDEQQQQAIKESLKDAAASTTATTTPQTPAQSAAARAPSNATAEATDDNDGPAPSASSTTAQPVTTTTSSSSQAAEAAVLTPAQQVAISEVMAATGAERGVAVNALEAVGWDANAAVGILLGD